MKRSKLKSLNPWSIYHLKNSKRRSLNPKTWDQLFINLKMTLNTYGLIFIRVLLVILIRLIRLGSNIQGRISLLSLNIYVKDIRMRSNLLLRHLSLLKLKLKISNNQKSQKLKQFNQKMRIHMRRLVISSAH